MRFKNNVFVTLGYVISLAGLAVACDSDSDDSDKNTGGAAGIAGQAGSGEAGAGTAGRGQGGKTGVGGDAGAGTAGQGEGGAAGEAGAGTAGHAEGGKTGVGGEAGAGTAGQGEGGAAGEAGAGTAGQGEGGGTNVAGQSGGGNSGVGGEAGAGTAGQGGEGGATGPAITPDGTWELVGARGFAESAGMSTSVRNIEMVVQGNNLYVGYVTAQNAEARVWRYSTEGESWEDLGQVADKANRISLTIDTATNQVVAAVDEAVKQYTGSEWETVGEGGIGEEGAVIGSSQGLFLAWQADDYNLAVDRLVEGNWFTTECSMTRKRAENYHLAQSPSGRIYASGKMTIKGAPTIHGAVVYELNEELGAWRELGGTIHDKNEVYDHDIAVSAAGLPYMAYGDFLGESFSVIRYDGEGDWTYVGDENILGNEAYHPSIAFAPQSSVPVVAYTETAGGDDGYPRVMAYSENSWVQLGDSYAISEEMMSANPDLALADDGTIYVAYWDYVDGAAAITVKRYSEQLDVTGAFAGDALGGGDSALTTKDAPTAAWPVVGEFGFTKDLTAGIRGDVALTIDENDHLYAGYIASSSNAPAGVWTYDGSTWSDLGDFTDSADHSYGLSLVYGNSTLYTATSVGFFAYGEGSYSQLGTLEGDGNLVKDPTTGALYSVIHTSTDNMLTVHKYAEGEWSVHSTIPVPQTDGLDFAQHHQLAVASDGTLFLSYHLQNAETVYLMRYTGTEWETLDTPVVGPNDSVYTVDLVLSPTDVPHLVIKEDHAGVNTAVSPDDLSILRFEDGASRWLMHRSILWDGGTSGEEGLSSITAPSVAFTSDGTLYVAYSYAYVGDTGPLQVLRYNEADDEFALVGGRENITGNYDANGADAQLVVDSKDNVYVGYQDSNNEYRLTVRRLVTW